MGSHFSGGERLRAEGLGVCFFFSPTYLAPLLVVFVFGFLFVFFWWPKVPRFFANHCMSSSHTKETMTAKAFSIGCGAKKICSLPLHA